jgi:hypothetical protein
VLFQPRLILGFLIGSRLSLILYCPLPHINGKLSTNEPFKTSTLQERFDFAVHLS